MNKSIPFKLITVFFVLLWSTAAGAWDGVVNGKITQIDTVSELNNYELRVFMEWQTMCNVSDPNFRTWAYLNSADTNYKAMVANLMMAYITGKTVIVYTMNDGGKGCHIHYVSVSG